MSPTPHGRRTAVVIGAGVAGLAAAAVLAVRFRQVLVLDRDRLPDGPVRRRGIPQGAHPHVLLEPGRHGLESLLPGLGADLRAAGASLLSSGSAVAFYRDGKLTAEPAVEPDMLCCSRPLLEWTIRRRLMLRPNVRITDRTAVHGLTGDAARVTGVATDAGGHSADLVVDCTGRGSRSDRWLATLGAITPPGQSVRVNVRYATTVIARGPHDLPAGSALYVLPTPPAETRFGAMLPIENDRWLVTLGGWHQPAMDADGYFAFARSLPYALIADLIAERATPSTTVAMHHFPTSHRRRFAGLPGFVALGDCVASVNPIYGRGMTAAAQQAIALGGVLDRHPTELSRALFDAIDPIVDESWAVAVERDSLWPQTAGMPGWPAA
jgi:flavin-dependent dehydrogenase